MNREWEHKPYSALIEEFVLTIQNANNYADGEADGQGDHAGEANNVERDRDALLPPAIVYMETFKRETFFSAICPLRTADVVPGVDRPTGMPKHLTNGNFGFYNEDFL